MFATVVPHLANDGQFETAMELFRRNTEQASKIKGFVSRQVLVSQTNPLKITTVTIWQTKEDAQAWLTNPERPRPAKGVFSKMELEVYEVAFQKSR